MTDSNAAATKDDKAGEAEPASRRSARASNGQRFTSDERRVLDALEDDEVREALRVSRKLSP